MRVLRPIFFIVLCVVPGRAATFGTVVSNPQGQSGISDIVLDEARRRFVPGQLVARAAIDVYGTNTNPPRLTSSVRTSATSLDRSYIAQRQVLIRRLL